jgi:putative nucleotidyltransferase with HDIG domain
MTQVAELNPAIDQFLARHQTIQAMPESAIRILRMTRDPNCDIGQLLKLIEQDAALSARIMKAVNSAYYALQTKMTRLDRAVAFMGLKAVKEVTASFSLAGMCKDTPIGNYSARDLWDHSVAVGILARELAVHSGTIDPEDAFLAGMLHDVGLLLVAQCDVERCKRIFAGAEVGTQPFTHIEQVIFGFNHCELGERLAQTWKFPEDVVAVIRWHHHPEEAPEEFKTLCRHIYIADTCTAAAKVGFSLTTTNQEIGSLLLDRTRLTSEIIAEATAKIPKLLRLHLG